MLSKLQTLKEEREQGFTLIELLVVILIIGILSAIAIPAFMNQRKSAVDSSVQSDVSNAAKMIETAAVKVGAGNIVFGPTGTPKTIAVAPATGLATITPTSGAAAFTTQVSDGTTMTIEGDTRDGYIIVGKNDGGDTAKSTGFTYNSKTGGM